MLNIQPFLPKPSNSVCYYVISVLKSTGKRSSLPPLRNSLVRLRNGGSHSPHGLTRWSCLKAHAPGVASLKKTTISRDTCGISRKSPWLKVAKGPRPEEVKTPLVSRGSFPHLNKHKERLNPVSLLVEAGVPFFQKIHPSVSLRFVVIGAWLFVILASVT